MSDPNPISPAFPFESRYADVLGEKMHYIEEGMGPTVLFIHGNPTSNYLWRNVIPHVSPHARCIAPDLIGMGKSAKPDIDYRFEDHARYLEAFIDALDLQDITLVLHDWGSALGFDYATRHPDRIRGIAFMESFVRPIESWATFAEFGREIFRLMRRPLIGKEVVMKRNAFVERVLPGAVKRKLGEEEMAAYRAPYPTFESRLPVWVWPNEIPVAGRPANVAERMEAYSQALCQWDIPKLHLWATPGALNQQAEVDWVQAHWPNVKSVGVGEGLHYIQEDCPHEIGAAIAGWLTDLSRGLPMILPRDTETETVIPV